MQPLNDLEPDWELKIYSEHRNRHENLPFDIDVWYPLLSDITYKTYFLPLTLKEAYAIEMYYTMRFIGKPNVFTSTEVQTLTALEHKLDSFINSTESFKTKGVFFRLCGRSAKDGDPVHIDSIVNEYKANLHLMVDKHKMDAHKGTTKLHAIAKTHWLKVRSGEEIISMLVTSERVLSDMRDWRQHGGKEQIVLREWDDGLDYDNEYRAFVYENKLTAITQYDHYGKYQHVIDTQYEVQELIRRYWEKEVKTRLKYPYYGVDFAYCNGKVKLIELSPFMRCTGTAMYKWDRDKEVLMYGDGSIRVNYNEYPEIELLADEWVDKWKHMKYFKDSYPSITVWESVFSWIWPKEEKKQKCFLFETSVIKEGFYWNKKYLNNAKKIGTCEVKGYEVIVDMNGMGWLVKGNSSSNSNSNEHKEVRCVGEVWEVFEEDLRDVKYFYGKKECKEDIINVELNNNVYKCYIYIYLKRKDEEGIKEYTIDIQNNKYNPIAHKVAIEENYLGYKLLFPN